MGKVYKAQDKELDRTIALKVLRPELVEDPLSLQRFKQELLLASKISHSNILRIHDLGDYRGIKFISMAFVEGVDLHRLLLKENPLPLARSLKIARQLCEALEAAHSEGVVHRDFKPQNVLVGKDDHAYVSDFGLATSLETAKMGMTRTGAVVGTPRYMSPEQVEGITVDSRSDLYSLGLVLYEMVAGDIPFEGDSTWQLMYQRVREKPKDPRQKRPEIPEWFSRIILHCLERKPGDRYQHAREILADIDSHHSPSLTRSIQINLPPVAVRWGLAGGAAAVLLVALFFAIPATRHLLFGGKSTAMIERSGLPPLAEGKIIAVLPFRVLGNENTYNYVAEGVGEALSAKLFQLKEVRLASPSAALSANNQDKPLPQIAKELGVNMIVHGLVQGSGDKLRIVVNLENMENNKLEWTQEFSGVAGDLLTIEDQIYAKLVEALKAKPEGAELAASVSHPSENVEAYDLYLRGRIALRSQQDTKNIQAAIDYFEQALKKDPRFALAYTGIADASLLMYGETKNSFWSQKSVSAAQQALALNPNLPEVHFALGAVYSRTGKNAEAISELQRALQLAPNSDEAYRRLGSALLKSGHGTEAIQALQKAVDINPYYWVNFNAMGIAYSQLGAYDKALAALRHIIELDPENSFGYLNVGAVYFMQGKYEDCIPYFQKALKLQPDYKTYSNLGTAYFYLKRYNESVPMFEKAVEMDPDDARYVGNLADAYRWSGQRDKANVTYDKAISLAYKQLEVNPRNSDTMGSLALYYAKKGDSAQALNFARRARSINKEDVGLVYIQAVVEALAGHAEDSLKTLREALRRGYAVEEAQNDPELASLQSRPEFPKLLAEFEKHN